MHTGNSVIGRCGAILSPGSIRTLCLAGLCASLVTGLAAAPAPAPPAMSSAEQAMLDAVNAYRASQGRDAWMAEPGLAAVARAHSQSMAAAGHFSHDGFRRRAESTGSAMCVENLMHGPVPPAGAVQMWLRSNSHRDNLLEPAARFAGVGMAGHYATLLACATALSQPLPATQPPVMHPNGAERAAPAEVALPSGRTDPGR